MLGTNGLKASKLAPTASVPPSGSSVPTMTALGLSPNVETVVTEPASSTQSQEPAIKAVTSHPGMYSVSSAVAACKLGLTDQLLAAIAVSETVVNAR
jgi:hypothetical protein